MSKFSFRRGELDKLDKLINKYNKKVNKLKNENYNQEFIPEKMKYKTLINSIIQDKYYTRNDLKDQIQIMESFIKKDSEKMLKSSRGLQIPKFKKREIEIKVKSINRDRAQLQREYNQTVLTDRNKPIEMPEENRKNFNLSKVMPKTFKWKNMSKNDYDWYMRTMVEYRQEREYRDEKYRENFYKAIDTQLIPEHAKELKAILNSIPTREIIKKYYTDLNMDIDFIYDKSDYEGKVNEIIDSWNSLKEQGGY